MSRNAESAETDEKSILGRRGYMRALGAVAASVGVLGTMTRDASAAEYETIELSEGEQRSFSVGSGETLENLLIDVRAPGADVHINASGDDWTVRNIGVRGTVDQGSNSGGFSNFLSMEGNGTVENVYFGDGIEAGYGHRRGAIGSGPSHGGHITVKNAYIAGWSDNGMYAAGSGRIRPPGTTDGEGGTYEIVDCYFRDNNISHIRMSSGESSVTGCVFENTGSVPENENGDVNSRGIYTGYGDPSQVITISDCDFALTGQDTNGAASALVSGTHGTYGPCSTLRVRNSQIAGEAIGSYVDVGSNVGSSPDTSVPADVPTSAKEAASGSSGGGSDNGSGDGDDGSGDGNGDDSSDGNGDGSEDGNGEESNILSISGGSGSNVIDYSLRVSGNLTKSEANGGTATSEDVISGSSAEGAVAGGVDSYEFDGELLAFDADDDVAVTLNGEPVDPSEFRSKHVLNISGGSGSNVIDYSLRVSGNLTKSEANGGTATSEDVISGSSAEGAVAGGVDSYEFDGELLAFDANDDVTVTVDGTEVDPTTL